MPRSTTGIKACAQVRKPILIGAAILVFCIGEFGA